MSNLNEGPGTELKKLISWFSVPTEGCHCQEHAFLMNQWGPQGCRNSMETILLWLERGAKEHGFFYTRTIGLAFAHTAILMAEYRAKLRDQSEAAKRSKGPLPLPDKEPPGIS